MIAFAVTKANSITRHDITWIFDKDYPVGEFVNGDPWVIGPVKIVAITNTLSDGKYKPEGIDVSGSQINPTANGHGFDERIKDYNPALNAALPNGKALSRDNPLVLAPNSSLVSTVSWLWLTPTEKEDGCPRAPEDWKKGFAWPTLRAASVLTALDKEPPMGSFRPPYAGDDKTIKFNVKDLRLDRLRKLAPVEAIIAASVPTATLHDHATLRPNYVPSLDGDPKKEGPISIDTLVRFTSRVWLDHIPGWYHSCVLHPSYNLPGYGREISFILQNAMLALQLDWEKFPEKPDKKTLAVNLVQIGIDLTGAAATGGYWPADGGHAHGRLPAVLFAGILLDDAHMKNATNWPTRFQDKEQTYYVTQEHIDTTKTETWREFSKRGGGIYPAVPYTEAMLGMPEWGFRPTEGSINAGWNIAYREINNAAIPGFALAFMMMEDGRKTFAHEPYFDYADRIESSGRGMQQKKFNPPPAFAKQMWETYRKDYPSTYDKKWDASEFVEIIGVPMNEPEKK